MLVPVTVMLAIGLWGLDRGGMWRDEAVTFQVARRSVPQIWQLLHSVDAVHGLYYLLMHAVLAPHPGEVALRLPSVCAAAATAGLVAALGVRLGRPRVGLWAGLLYAVTPMAGHFAQEGRSYALVAAGVAGATLLLVRAARGREAGGRTAGRSPSPACCTSSRCWCCSRTRRPWRSRGCPGGCGGAGGARRAPRCWCCCRSPSSRRGQSAQVAWLSAPGLRTAWTVCCARSRARRSWFSCRTWSSSPWPCVSRSRHGAGELTLRAVALPLMVVPPAVLMTVSRFWPLYDERYVLYALAGAPLLAAAGAERLVAMVPTARPSATLTGVLAIALVFVSQLPVLRQDRVPDRRPDNLAVVSAVAGRELRPGDPVLFLPSLGGAPRWRTRTASAGCGTSRSGSPGRCPAPCTGRRRTRTNCDDGSTGLDRVWVVAEPFALTAGLVSGERDRAGQTHRGRRGVRAARGVRTEGRDPAAVRAQGHRRSVRGGQWTWAADVGQWLRAAARGLVQGRRVQRRSSGGRGGRAARGSPPGSNARRGGDPARHEQRALAQRGALVGEAGPARTARRGRCAHAVRDRPPPAA